MGNIIQIENGIKTVYVNGQNINSLSANTNTYYVGIDLTSGSYEKLNPDGSIVNLEAGSIIDTTHNDLYTLIGSNGLTPGIYYNITDFETIYDQPDYFIDGGNKSVVTTNTGSNNPLIVLATSTNNISTQAYYFNTLQNIWYEVQYDVSFIVTEVNGSPAKGRITELIDENGNRADYDHSDVEFKRYQNYEKNTQLTGTITGYDCTTGLVVGVGTAFLSEVSVGDILIMDTYATLGLGYDVGVKVASISDDLNLFVYVDAIYNGTIIPPGFSYIDFYNSNALGTYTSYKEIYVAQSDEGDFTTQVTFPNSCYNNYIGDFAKFATLFGLPFILSNNVFGIDCYSNTFGDNCYNNYFGSDTQNNKIGDYCYGNTIESNFAFNKIGDGFSYNSFGLTCSRNNLGDDFSYNQIESEFSMNDIGHGFDNNIVGTYFKNNKIGLGCSSNTFGANFGYGGAKLEGNILGNGCNGNTFGDYCYGNQIGNLCTYNIIGNYFQNNKIDNYFGNDLNFPTVNAGTGTGGGNLINNYFRFNEIGNNFIWNIIDTYFEYNKIGTDFWINIFGQNNRHNTIGDLFVGNVGTAGYPNAIGDGFTSNKFGNYTPFNEIGSSFAYNVIGDFFGNAGVGTENNISNNFQNNNIQNYFGDDGTHLSGGNTILDDFRLNNVTTDTLYSVDFTPATYVYGDYNCTLFKRSDGFNRLSYYSADTLTIVDLDS